MMETSSESRRERDTSDMAKGLELPHDKAARTAKWAVTMAKWRIGFVTGGRILGGKTVRAFSTGHFTY